MNAKQKLAAALVCLLAVVWFVSGPFALYRTYQAEGPSHTLFGATNTESGNVPVTAHRLDQHTAPTAAIGMNSQKFTGLANATSAGEAVTFGQQVTQSTDGLMIAADKLTLDQCLLLGPKYCTIEDDDFHFGGAPGGTGAGTTGGAVISNTANGVVPFGKFWRTGIAATTGRVRLITTGQNTNHHGIIAVDCGNSTSGGAGILRGATSTPNVTFGVGTTYTTTAWVMVPTVSNGTDTFTTRVGYISAASATPADSCAAEYSSASPHSGNWICRSFSGSTPTNGSGGTPVALVAGTWYTVTVTNDGSGCACTVDGTNIGSISGSVTSASIFEGIATVKSAGTTADSGEFRIDWIRMKNVTPAGRT